MSERPFIPYGRQSIDEDDVAAVVDVLRGAWLTQGPSVDAFEAAFAETVGARHAVAVNSGTAALHAITHALSIGPGDEVIVPPITFTASANCVVFRAGVPVFADVDPDTLLLDPRAVESKITKRTRAIIAVDFAGQVCDYEALRKLADSHGVSLVADACHSLGARSGGRAAGSLALLNAFSFHPVKHITTGEGGMVSTDDSGLAQRMRLFRTHGITREAKAFLGLGGEGALAEKGPWYYEMQELGYNYRLSDIGSALGLTQLRKLARFVERRRAVARRYAQGLCDIDGVKPLRLLDPAAHAWHLYVVRIDFRAKGWTRSAFMEALRRKGVGTQVHYIPVHLQPFYRGRFGLGPGLCPVAEAAYGQLLSLPMYPAMTDDDVDYVIETVRTALRNGPA
jgi:perosamine synthetase